MFALFCSPLSFRLVRRFVHYLYQESVQPRSLWTVVGVGLFMVSVPVFFQAPLVRIYPWVSLALTLPWVLLGQHWQSHPQRSFWGQVLLGFSWSWLAGSLYWGWLRWEPLYHLPVEAIGLPIALWGITQNQNRLGNWFYLGSLFGTAVTDLYFYLAGVMPYWTRVMQVDPPQAMSILQEAILQVQTPWGIFTAMICAALLTIVSLRSLRSPHAHHWIFGGAVLGTLMVDSLFGLAAVL
ncbi:MAG: DUF3120 domain-containing protein [Prochlorotrichaceae cyanobacterium]